MRDRVQEYIDSYRIPIRRELIEELRILPLALPRILDVRVVGHQHHDPAAPIGDAAEVDGLAVVAALRGAAAAAPPVADVRNLRNLLQLEHRSIDRMTGLDVEDRILERRQYPSDLRLELLPRRRA